MITTQVPSAGRPADVSARIALDRARALLLSCQRPDGSWDDGQCPGVAVAAQSVLTRDLLAVQRPEQAATAARLIRSRQRPDGSWAQQPGGAPDRAATVACYVALRVAGDPADAYHLALAAGWLREAGGLRGADPVTMSWLWLAGLGSWPCGPVVPPEVLFWPAWVTRWLPGEVPRATRSTVPLSVIGSPRQTRQHPPFDLSEIAPASAAGGPLPSLADRPGSLDGVFSAWQWLTPALPPLRRLRVLAHRRSARWLLARQDRDGSWGASAVETQLALIALGLLGHGAGHRSIDRGLHWLDRQVAGVLSEAGREAREGLDGLDAAAAVRGTALAVRALAAAGLSPSDPALTRATAYLNRHRSRRRPDRPSPLPGQAPAARAAQELAVLSAAGLAAGKRARRAGVWLLRAQAAEGSWPAADGLGDPIVTSLVLQALASAGVGSASDSIKRAARWLASVQRAGSPPAGGGWSGVPGSAAAPTTLATSAVVLALLACGDAESQAAAGRGVAWLARAQRGDGGWDDSPAGEGSVDGFNRASQERGTGPDLERMCQAVEALSRYLSLTV